jgi:hypothetical protein
LHAFARLWAPQTQPAVAAQETSNPAVTAPIDHLGASSAGVKAPSGEFADKIKEKIRMFFSQGTCGDADKAYYCVPKDPRAGIRFVIVFLIPSILIWAFL